ncbi:MAG: VUT family protein [Salinarimonadaceae bacterium]|nr:MAG: VUT family protein [Salinarimonadaceae bacterium]
MLASSDRSAFLVAIAAMAVIVVASNILVQHPVQAWGLQDYLTYGAFTYPFAFLVTDLANRRFGPLVARRVVYIGFALAVALSIYFATPRIAIASGTAFLFAQLIDIRIFNVLRARAWWVAPLASSIIGSAVDTAIFFSFAFHCEQLPWGMTITQMLGVVGIPDECIALPWRTLAIADYGVKLSIAAVALIPYGALLRFAAPREAVAGRG